MDIFTVQVSARMEKVNYDEPRLAINRVYTRQGDCGDTALVGGQRVPKDDTRIAAYGTVDELNSFLGAARSTVNQLAFEEPRLALLAAILLRVQHELFNLGSILATLPEDVHPRQPRVTEAEIAQLETEMDLMNEDMPPLRSFVLPGGSRLDAELHIGRTVCRRAERIAVTLGRTASVCGYMLLPASHAKLVSRKNTKLPHATPAPIFNGFSVPRRRVPIHTLIRKAV